MNATEAEKLERLGRNAALIQSLARVEGDLESPIDLDISHMEVIELKPLEWTGLDSVPKKLKILNTGYTVIVSASWQQQSPLLSGGPFAGDYTFKQMHLHWGENEMNGSEHSVDGSRHPMELHAVYFKGEYDTLESALWYPDGVSVLVYFCKLQNAPNEFVGEIIKHFSSIRAAHSSDRMVPRNLTGILKPFTRDYFAYWGSVIINKAHPALWIICREPIGISVDQIAEFRALTDERGFSITSNIRPLKAREGRHVYHVCPSGSTYASLLPIPRVLENRQAETTTSATDDVAV